MPKVSFIVPLYNGLALTQVCLRTLRETLPPGLAYEIILVDDGSTDGTRDWLATLGEDPAIEVLLNEVNCGFADSNNKGAHRASGDYLALVNSDLEFLPGWLEPMLEALDRDASLALVGNVQRRVDDNSVDHAGIRFCANAKLEHIKELPSAFALKCRPLRFVSAVTAACCIVRRELFMAPRRDRIADVGEIAQPGFRVSYRNGGEDVDLCLEQLQRGYRIGVCLNSVVRHHVSASRGTARPHDEANSRNLFGYWRSQIINLCATDWARQKLVRWRTNPRSVPLRVAAVALAHRLSLTNRTPRVAWLEIGSAIFYEELHWRQVLGLPRPPASGDAADYVLKDLREDSLQHETRACRDGFRLRLPPGTVEKNIFLNGFLLPPTPNRPETHGPLGLRLFINDQPAGTHWPLPEGHFNIGVDRPLVVTDETVEFSAEIIGAGRQNFLAWLARISRSLPLPNAWRQFLEAHRVQLKNRRIRISQILADDEVIYDFSKPRPLRIRHRQTKDYPSGLNIVGWFRAELGIGESARCMARATAAAGLDHALVDMKLPCLNRMGDNSLSTLLQKTNPYRVNVFHIDPPVSRDIDHHHGGSFRRERYNIAYWAWELPEFPDEWVAACEFYNEIWTPSAFCRDAIAAKTPLPVHVMPHAIEFAPPLGDQRARFGLPADRTTFLFLYDLNSYDERKNPHAVIESYRAAFPAEIGVHLVIKTQNPERNPDAFARLQRSLAGLGHTTLITETLSREDVYALEAACDVFVSLHRSEGFGLAVAETMYLGKPVISTDWSATAEFVDSTNGCPIPVDLIELTETRGPYQKGQIWANPRIAAASEAMRRLAASPDLRARLGAQAARTIRKRFSPSVIGACYARRLQAMRLWPD